MYMCNIYIYTIYIYTHNIYIYDYDDYDDHDYDYDDDDVCIHFSRSTCHSGCIWSIGKHGQKTISMENKVRLHRRCRGFFVCAHIIRKLLP